MTNFTDSTYPYFTYVPSRFAAVVFVGFVYLSLFAWLLQSLPAKCRPPLLAFFLFTSHLVTLIELILRATLSVDERNTKTLYMVTAPLLAVGPRFLLMANYHCLVEMRGNVPRRTLDRVIDIVVPVGAIGADVLLGMANHFSFHSDRLHLSFRLRQASAGLILSLAAFFYIVWHLAVSQARRRYVIPLLSVSSTCVLVEAMYVQANAVRSVFFPLHHNELWFYMGHLVPIALALVTWSIFHPRRMLPPPQTAVPHDEEGKEMLPPPPKV